MIYDFLMSNIENPGFKMCLDCPMRTDRFWRGQNESTCALFDEKWSTVFIMFPSRGE